MTPSRFTQARRTASPRRCAIAGAIALATGLAWTIAVARPIQPNHEDRQITLAVSLLMERQHLTGQPLDNKISQRCLETFIKDLDPMKLFFYQSDIDEFNRSRNDLDNQFHRADIRFAYDVFARFLARVDERINVAQELLKQEHDFTIDEEMVRDPEAAKFPASPSEAADRWRQRVK